jgi:hypothetical protein
VVGDYDPVLFTTTRVTTQRLLNAPQDGIFLLILASLPVIIKLSVRRIAGQRTR